MPWAGEPWRRRLPLRWLLGLAYVCLIGFCLLSLCSLIYYRVSRFLWFTGERELVAQLIPIARERGPEGLQAGPDLRSWSSLAVRVLAEPRQLIRVVTPQGELLASSGARRSEALPPLRPGPAFLWKDGRRLWQVRAFPVYQRGQVAAYLMLGRRWQPSAEILQALATELTLGSLLVLSLAGLLSYGLARLLSRPLECVAQTAQRFAAGDLAARTRLGRGKNEIYEVAAAFDEMGERVQQAFQAQAQFVADASHELKTPLTAISGMLEILHHYAGPEDVKNRELALKTIEKETDRMSTLVRDLLTLSRNPQGTATRREPVDVGKMLREAAEQMRVLWPEHQIDTNGEAIALADPDQLQRVMRNLLDNALKYTAGGGHIQLRCGSERGRSWLEVEDNGVGIAAEDLAHVFDRFYRADPSRSRATGGSGLGLSIARALVQEMGGQIELRSEPGQGTCARVELPSGNL